MQVYQESASFSRRKAADAWAKRRETELNEPGALERANRNGATVKEMIDRYLDEYERIRPLGSVRKVRTGRITAMTGWRPAWQSVTNSLMPLGS
ncbi:hypothetical protein D3C78_1789720 [compost metagenome]